MAGQHEPSSPTSFYASLGTAALRGILVVGAIVLGVFVLSRAFPSPGSTPAIRETPTGGGQPTTGGGGGGKETSPPATPRETASPQECPDPQKVTVQVLNGTEVDGLAAETAQRLEDLGYRMPIPPGNAQRDYETSVIFAKKDSTVAAECLKDEEFKGAEIDRAAPDVEVDVSVILGADYAERRA